MSYNIVRMYQNPEIHNQTLITGLTLEEAQEHCRDTETSSSTCTHKANIAITEANGAWFDGYEERYDDLPYTKRGRFHSFTPEQAAKLV